MSDNKGRVITISESLAAELAMSVEFMMDEYKPVDSGSDYYCHFCEARSENDYTLVIHKPDCLGRRALAALKGLNSNG
jgi:hypothetical protein